MTLSEFCEMSEAVLAVAESESPLSEAGTVAILLLLLKRNHIHMPSEIQAAREQARMQADITDAVKMAAATGKLGTLVERMTQ